MSNTNGNDSKPQSIFKSGWLWVAVFFAAVCVVGALTGGVGSKKDDPLENARTFNSDSTVSVSVLDETDLSDISETETTEISLAVVTSEETQSEESDEKSEVESTWDGKTVYITPSGKRYHIKASCAGANAIETDRKSAEESYTPCRRCAKELGNN